MESESPKAPLKAVIIAAGQGTRLRALAASKPLAEVAGTPLIEHVVRSAFEAGVREFVVATGYEAEPLEAFLGDLAARLGVAIEPVRNPDWSLPNGYSVLSAGARAGEAFVLLMSDHLFDPSILRDLLAADRQGAALTLAVDERIDNPQLDLDDATKVEVAAEGRIAAIGKALSRYNAIDTGIFIAGAELLEALRSSIAAGGSGSLSEGVEALARRGEARAWSIGGRFWLDVDDEAAFAKAEARLAPQPSPAT